MTYDLKIRQHLDCFGKNGRGCKVLNATAKKDCLTCNFYKPERDHELDQEKALKRLKSLDKATRLGIAEKYQIKGIL